MDLEKEVKKIDAEFIRLIIAGEFKLVGIGNFTTTIEVGNYHLNMWMSGGSRTVASYHWADDPIYSSLPRYDITHMSKHEEVFSTLDKLRTDKFKAEQIEVKRAQLAALKKELGEE